MLAVVLVTVVLAGSPEHTFSPKEKAYYADANTINFVRPGLVIKILSATIASDGTITATVQITDPKGLPLDRNGVTTPGAVGLSFIAAYIPKGKAQYVAYTTRMATATNSNNTAIQAGADSGGSFANPSDGTYVYTFKTRASTGWDPTVTHTIGVYGSRSLTEFDLGTNYASATYNFVPNGSPVTVTRDVIRTQSCDRCHDELAFHGGSRRGIELCVLCHTPQTTDPTTGNTVNMPVMIHEIHIGSSSPKLLAGGQPYAVSGHNGLTDWSDVVFPADARRCEVCHDQTTGAAQAKNYLTNPNRAACGGCHDDINFATGQNHSKENIPEVSDNQCAGCHIPQGELEFDASIKGAHVIPTQSSQLPGAVVKILKVDDGSAGKAPTVTYTLKDNAGNPIAISDIKSTSAGRIGIVMAGPTSDYGYTSFGPDVTTPGYVSEDGTKGNCDGSGTCTYTFTHSIPTNAKGTYAIGIEVRRGATLNPGTTQQMTTEYGAINQVTYFSVDGSPVTPRRTVVNINNCNQCHAFLSVHGENRNRTEMCVLCHNPSETDKSTRANATNPADKAAPPQAVEFAYMVHRIHTGANLVAQGAGYTVVGFGGSHNDFSDVAYPAFSLSGSVGDTRNCSMCHVNGSEQNLPTGKNNVTNPQGPINPMGAVAAACLGCHATIPEASHALANTTTLGESCEACHSASAAFAISKVHAQ